MTVNYFIECPTCGKITRMRSPAGYIYSTPVRIHCGNCKTLLTGNFISDNKRIKAYFVPGNCKSIDEGIINYDYFGEAAGEMICNKIQKNESGEFEFIPTPVFEFLQAFSIIDREKFINYAFFLSEMSHNWDNERIIYDLFLNESNDLISKNYHSLANSFGYNLSTQFGIIKFIYFLCFRNLWGLYNESETRRILMEINHIYSHMGKRELFEYASYLMDSGRLYSAQKAMFGIIFDFIKISQNIIPAIGVRNYYNDSSVDKTKSGISTCTFTDISTYYQNTYESLVEYSDIIVALDNIEYRGNYKIRKNGDLLEKFLVMDKGNKIKSFNEGEFFETVFNINTNANHLRNAIGHNDYSFDGITQEIHYLADKRSQRFETKYLLDMCLECVDLTRSLFVILFCIYELFRTVNQNYDNSLPNLFYSQVDGKSRCPCGSNLKYRNCCKDRKKINISSTTLYKHVANCAMDLPPNGFSNIKSKKQ